MTPRQRVALAMAALCAVAAGAFLKLRSDTPAPDVSMQLTEAAWQPANEAIEEPAPPATPVVETDAGSRPSFASAQLDAQERSEQEVTARISAELELSAAEREAVKAALKKLHAGRHQQFARLIDGSADEAEMTAGLKAHHAAFDEDIAKALGAARAKTFQARFDEAYGITAKSKAP